MFSIKNLNNNWLASNKDDDDTKKNKKGRTWSLIKKVISWGYTIYRILDFFFSDSA
jgi:hypothetical protein